MCPEGATGWQNRKVAVCTAEPGGLADTAWLRGLGSVAPQPCTFPNPDLFLVPTIQSVLFGYAAQTKVAKNALPERLKKPRVWTGAGSRAQGSPLPGAARVCSAWGCGLGWGRWWLAGHREPTGCFPAGEGPRRHPCRARGTPALLSAEEGSCCWHMVMLPRCGAPLQKATESLKRGMWPGPICLAESVPVLDMLCRGTFLNENKALSENPICLQQPVES